MGIGWSGWRGVASSYIMNRIQVTFNPQVQLKAVLFG